MVELPIELWLAIFSLLDLRDVLTCMLLSKQLMQIALQHTSLELEYVFDDFKTPAKELDTEVRSEIYRRRGLKVGICDVIIVSMKVNARLYTNTNPF